MRAQLTQQELLSGLAELGIDQQRLAAAARAPGTLAQAKERFDALKAEARKAFKRKALELHPDRTDGDEAKTDLFKRLQLVVEVFCKAELRPAPPPRPQVQVVRVYGGFSSTSSTTSSGWSSVTFNNGTWRTS